MRNTFVFAGFVLAGLGRVLAQDTPTVTKFSLSPSDAAHRSSLSASWALSDAAVSSLIGPFRTVAAWQDQPFFPSARSGDFLSAIGTSGPKGETTTYVVSFAEDVLDPNNTMWRSPKRPYHTATLAPTEYWDDVVQESLAYVETITFGPSSTSLTTSTYFYAAALTTYCSHSIILPKSPLDDMELLYGSSSHNPDNWPTPTAACTVNGVQSFEGGETTYTNMVFTINGVEDGNAASWPYVTFLGEQQRTTGTGTGTAAVPAETGSVVTSGGPAQTGAGADAASQSTSTQSAAAAEVTVWRNAAVVVGAVAALAL